jgi:predicted DNA-binding transcriptional regulator AlpA
MSEPITSLVSTSQASSILGISPSTFWRRLKLLQRMQRWTPKPIQVGTSFLYSKSDIELLRAAFRR